MARIPIGVALDGEGAHPAAWRASDRAPVEQFSPAALAARIRRLDASGLGFATLPDDTSRDAYPNVQARLDTVEAATFLAAASTRIGLVPAVNAVHGEPYHLANQLNTLDWASRGRAGWLVGARESAAIAAGYGREAYPTAAAAARDAHAVLATVRRLWDTWEDDVLIADRASERFLDLDRWHYADVETEFFRVKGPGLLPRPPQGQVVVWTEWTDADASADALQILAGLDPDSAPAPLVDIVVITASTGGALIDRARRAAELGFPRRVAAVEVALDTASGRAADRIAALDRFTPWTPGERLRITGSAAEVAERLARLAGEVDGIRLHPAVLDVDLPVIVDDLLPRLDAAEALREPDADATLRDLFGLPRPVNVFELAKESR